MWRWEQSGSPWPGRTKEEQGRDGTLTIRRQRVPGGAQRQQPGWHQGSDPDGGRGSAGAEARSPEERRAQGARPAGHPEWGNPPEQRLVLRPRAPRRFGSSVTSVRSDAVVSAFLQIQTGKHSCGRGTGTPCRDQRVGWATRRGLPPKRHVLEARERVEGPHTVHTSKTVGAGNGRRRSLCSCKRGRRTESAQAGWRSGRHGGALGPPLGAPRTGSRVWGRDPHSRVHGPC